MSLGMNTEQRNRVKLNAFSKEEVKETQKYVEENWKLSCL